MLYEPDGRSTLYCPNDGAMLACRHGPHGQFYGCTRYPECRYAIGGKRARQLIYGSRSESDARDASAAGKLAESEARPEEVRRLYTALISPEEIDELLRYHAAHGSADEV